MICFTAIVDKHPNQNESPYSKHFLIIDFPSSWKHWICQWAGSNHKDWTSNFEWCKLVIDVQALWILCCLDENIGSFWEVNFLGGDGVDKTMSATDSSASDDPAKDQDGSFQFYVVHDVTNFYSWIELKTLSDKHCLPYTWNVVSPILDTKNIFHFTNTSDQFLDFYFFLFEFSAHQTA